MILSLEDVSFKYVIEPVLDHVNFVVNEKDKWGVVGMNGAGKSTFLRILAGEEQPDTGKVTIQKKYKISYCPQNMEFQPGRTVYETVRSYMSEETEVYQINAILNKLGITDYNQQIDVLSGGQKKRVALAIALIRQADLYLLDEPTNHLDQEMILWLEKYLTHVSRAVVLVTHDRYFLSRITNHIVDVENGHLYQYDGNYADYLEQREVRREQAAAIEQKRQNFLRTEIEWIRAGAQARSTKQKSRIERFEQIAAMDAPKDTDALQMKSAVTRLGRNTVKLDHISKAYGDKKLFSEFSYDVRRMDRLGIIGANGCGKSTLLKIIMGQVQPDSGTVTVGETVKFGYFAQQNEVFEEDERVIDYIKEFGEVVRTADNEEITASQMLERFLFDKDEQYKPISKCSGGEKRRLYLCSILMTAPNILILDEPTNDLDTDTLTILEDYLENFQGAVLTVSHDRYFLDKAVDHLLIFENGRITERQQVYSDYLESKAEQKQPSAQPAKVREKKPSEKLSYKEKKELESLELNMPKLEQEIAGLEEQLNSVTDYKEIQDIGDLLQNKRDELEEKETRWMELSEKVE
ncbi:MAG: ABC-F family ATP-binding cassette domain-containing protein [Solobacterium sp.]|jgi:ATP-binding cassette subfamily F protein uup|nr:ABC-F family ATP-binding cassette domain-containing protein [Solobacterium sp.]